ncbi:hypothetical protein JCM19274_5330 [Algibacter lectus]|uniref:Uncharacterized protein n=1 Tax=Algibacter lectus TaxID=221126 RepID=A0A090X4E0_9FLAO|nr:hypothetical protein JCM19274_5330 [Algibacter lectus]
MEDNGLYLVGMENSSLRNNQMYKLRLGYGLNNMSITENSIFTGCISIPTDALKILNEKNTCN